MLQNLVLEMLQNKSKPIFFVDAMLGNIAKKLRLFGYDSEYSSDINDNDLIMRLKNENRILITKDTLLSKIAQKEKISVIQVTKNTEIEQLVQIFKILKLEEIVVNGNNARCTGCNGELKITDKDIILNRVPKGVIEKIDEFWKCTNCDQVYWEGTHIEKLQKFVVELNGKI